MSGPLNRHEELKQKSKVIEEQVRRVIEESTPRIKGILGPNLSKEPYKYKPTEMGGGASSSRFLGLPLPLLPDISKSEIIVGKDDPILGVLGIRQRGDTMVNL